MASSLAAQLSQIAARSTNQLDLKAQRSAHSQSLIFEKKIAGSQDFNTVYQIALEGFQELCQLDSRFVPFSRTIFSEQSKDEDRTQMTAAQNEELNNVLEAFVSLVGSKLLLKPAVKALDWLVRRFRIHEYNTSILILTFLPYHTTPLFLNLLSILPNNVSSTFKFLQPYTRSLVNPPRHPIVHSATTNVQFFTELNSYVLRTCSAQHQYHGLLSFWAGIVTEAVAGMLDSARSGRQEIERQKQEDVMLRVLPILNQGFSIKGVPELTTGCHMITVVLASKAAIGEKVVDALMEAAVNNGLGAGNTDAVVCLATLAQRKIQPGLPGKVATLLLKRNDLSETFASIRQQYRLGSLALCLFAETLKVIQSSPTPAALGFMKDAFQPGLLNEEQSQAALELLVSAATEIESAEAQAQVAELFHTLQASNLRPVLEKAIESSSVTIQKLEYALQSVISGSEVAVAEDVEMIEAPTVSSEELLQQAISKLPTKSVSEKSFLANSVSQIFEPLAQTFLLASKSSNGLDTFTQLPILRKDAAAQDPFYLTFFVRVACGPFTLQQRSAALSVITSYLSSAKASPKYQALLPYVIFALTDSSSKIRKEASNLAIALDRAVSGIESDKSSVSWGPDGFYGSVDDSTMIPSSELSKAVKRVFISNIEALVLDSAQVREAILETFKAQASVSTPQKESASDLKKATRSALFQFLCQQVLRTPLLKVKLCLLKILNQVDKVGTHSRTSELFPLVREWASLTETQADTSCKAQAVSRQELEVEILNTVSAASRECSDLLIFVVEDQDLGASVSVKKAALTRLHNIWTSTKADSQFETAEKLLAIALGTSSTGQEVQEEAQDFLRNVPLTEQILVAFLAKIDASLTDIKDQEPAPKRRRTSQNEMVAMSMKDSKEMSAIIQRTTFILELVDGSKPEEFPSLAEGLFQVLGDLHHFKAYMQSELSYLLSLVLGSLLVIINKVKTGSKSLPTVHVRADLIVDCIRTTESPQVQNTALLLVAGLARVAPEIVLHSVMPIFTFMGSNVLKKDDEYSAHVIDQTIDQVIPPLIQSLRTQKRDIVSGTSELLLSFTTALEHIPSHRRLRLFEALIAKLGPADFFFAVLAMLAKQYPGDINVRGFMTALVGRFNSGVLVTSFHKYLSLVSDTLAAKPSLSQILLGIGNEDDQDVKKIALDLLHTLSHLLKAASVTGDISKSLKKSDAFATKLRQQFSELLEQVLAFIATFHGEQELYDASNDVLGALLGTLSLTEYIQTISELLNRSDDELRRKVLRLLDARLQSSTERDPTDQNSALDFLPTLSQIIIESSDVLLKHAAVACIDRISDKYGKKNVGKVAAAARVVTSQSCIGQEDDRIRVMGVLCLASMSEVLGQAIIPILPEMLSRSLQLLQGSLEEGKENPRLHDAVFSLLSALFSHVPYMISDVHLDGILKLAFESANSDIGDESDESRREALQLLAKQVDVPETFAALERNWPLAVAEGPEAAKEVLDVLQTAIEKHSKASVAKNADLLAKFFLKAFDLRRTQATAPQDESYEADEITDVEESLNKVAIQMIYKLNDTSFRPIFIKFNDWATSGLPKKDVSGRDLRLTSFYSFLGDFFDSLKSIVTSYASYVIDTAVEVLNRESPETQDSKTLWARTMTMLRNAFEHDQDEFWQTPTHFNTIIPSLLKQLSHADQFTSEEVSTITIETIVSLASASADSPDNMKELNTALIKLFRHDEDAVRLAAVQTERALTGRLGEEWLAYLPEMLPGISELLEDDDEDVEKEVRSWISEIEGILGESLEGMLS